MEFKFRPKQKAPGLGACFEAKFRIAPEADALTARLRYPWRASQVAQDLPILFGLYEARWPWARAFRYTSTERGSWRGNFGKLQSWPKSPCQLFPREAALCRAAENTCYFATVNFASDGSPTTWAMINPDGTLLSYQPYGQEGLLVAAVEGFLGRPAPATQMPSTTAGSSLVWLGVGPFQVHLQTIGVSSVCPLLLRGIDLCEFS